MAKSYHPVRELVLKKTIKFQQFCGNIILLGKLEVRGGVSKTTNVKIGLLAAL